MPEIHLRQPEFTYSACDHLQKKITKKEYKNLKKQEIHDIFIKTNMPYGDFKDLTRRTASDKTLRDKAFNIVKNPKYDGY